MLYRSVVMTDLISQLLKCGVIYRERRLVLVVVQRRLHRQPPVHHHQQPLVVIQLYLVQVHRQRHQLLMCQEFGLFLTI